MLIEYRALKADAIWDFSCLAASQRAVKTTELCGVVQVVLQGLAELIWVAQRDLCSTEVWTGHRTCLAAVAGLQAVWQPAHQGVCAQLPAVLSARKSPKLSSEAGRGGAVLEEKKKTFSPLWIRW